MPASLHIDLDAEGLATATIRVPDRSMNVLTNELVAELSALVDRTTSDAAIRGVILTAEGNAFIAGADLKDLVEMYDRGMSTAEAFEFSHSTSRLLRRMETCGKPFVAAI